MKYRIILEVDTDMKREAVNFHAKCLHDEAVSWFDVVYLATEVVEGRRDIIVEKE